MTTMRKKFQAWRERRRRDRLERWEHTRVQGKARFVLRIALLWGGIMVLSNVSIDYLIKKEFLLWTVVYFAVASPLIGFVSWWQMEGEYRAAKIDARMKAL